MSDGRRDPQNAYLTSAFQKQSVDSTVAQMLGISNPDYQFRSEQRIPMPPSISCTACGRQITSNYIEKSGRPYCSDACAGPTTATTAKASIIAPSAEAQQLRKAQEREIHQNIQAGKSKCGTCGNVISDLSAVEYKGVMYHEYCFACSKCGQQIGSVVGFASTPSGPVCNSCASSQGAALCVKCKGKITGKYLNAPGGAGKLHPQCFVCTSCKGDLASGYVERGGQNYCVKCSQSGGGGGGAGASYGQHQKGFVIDPRTGQKRYV
eukprot:TRINITY_DN3895_c0_g1_i1.p1 TRINITY_DN3895_c0_g1~~TRINITY_DN3895_c0_g1_i1.p1  ORF type:complete len:265 (-),score=52.11 TRINITY_DN3895_c0_g1_i1:222-1016(-)